MRLPLDIVKLITSYLPSKKLPPWIVKLIDAKNEQECYRYLWGNPNVFEAGLFSESELPYAPMKLIAGNPACSNYVIGHWQEFKTFKTVWRNPCLWEYLKTQLNLPIDWKEFGKNSHPDAILYMQRNGIAIDRTNPGYICTIADFEFSEGSIIDTFRESTWANPSAVPFLQQIVANKGHPKYAWFIENPHPWAIHAVSQSSDALVFCSAYIQDLCQNEGIFETVDFSELQFLLSQI